MRWLFEATTRFVPFSDLHLVCQADLYFTDDTILAGLGSPDEFTGEKKEKFIAGLRQVLTGLRARKVKDFDTIANEIVAHRAKFLGDKILPLEGTTL